MTMHIAAQLQELMGNKLPQSVYQGNERVFTHIRVYLSFCDGMQIGWIAHNDGTIFASFTVLDGFASIVAGATVFGADAVTLASFSVRPGADIAAEIAARMEDGGLVH